jgi:hypothetical protein
MKNIYSSRGARRGMLIAVIAVSIWMGWAVGYVQGTDTSHPEMQLIAASK